jgi:bifunctional DNA-binding transcriptional regulator/antitoxin component of YhaV-PrlF toxin-antitoxin module
MDSAGRLVVPKPLRDRLGLMPGVVEVEVDGADLRVRPIAGDTVSDDDGWLVVPASGSAMTDDEVQALRDADQR